MDIFYYTFGSDDGGGWAKVVADDRDTADKAFTVYHPCGNGLLACASVYTAEQFSKTSMAHNGNFGRGCVEVITLTRRMMA